MYFGAGVTPDCNNALILVIPKSSKVFPLLRRHSQFNTSEHSSFLFTNSRNFGLSGSRNSNKKLIHPGTENSNPSMRQGRIIKLPIMGIYSFQFTISWESPTVIQIPF